MVFPPGEASAERGRVQGPGRAEADPGPGTVTVGLLVLQIASGSGAGSRTSRSVRVAGRPSAFVDDPIALIGDAVTVISSDLGLVQGRPAAGQVGLGGLQSPLGRLGAGLGLLDPDVVQGQGGQPLALGD
jgi:hypothetical protein